MLFGKDRIPAGFLNLKSEFLRSLVEELRDYFSEGSYALFEIFVPKKLPRITNESFIYGHDEIQELAKKFDLDAETASKE